MIERLLASNAPAEEIEDEDQEERRHAQRALSIMMNIQWKNNCFESIEGEYDIIKTYCEL